MKRRRGQSTGAWPVGRDSAPTQLSTGHRPLPPPSAPPSALSTVASFAIDRRCLLHFSLHNTPSLVSMSVGHTSVVTVVGRADVAPSPPPPSVHVHGAVVDAETRCIHWSSPRDIVALQFFCCRRFYPCYQCHQLDVQQQSGPPHSSDAAQTWPRESGGELAVLCGACRRLLSIDEYVQLYEEGRSDPPCCPGCAAPFNPGCRKHLHLYFDIDPARHDKAAEKEARLR